MNNRSETPAKTTTGAKRLAPKLVPPEEGGSLEVTITQEDQLQTLYGSNTPEAAQYILYSALTALEKEGLGKAGLKYMDLIPAMAVEMEPRDAVEAMLVSQISATNIAMTSLSCRLADAQSIELRETHERSITRYTVEPHLSRAA